MISNYAQKIKDRIEERKIDLSIAAIIFLVGLASFGLGRLSAVLPEKTPVTVTESAFVMQKSGEAEKGRYVASKNGSAYHLPSCSGAQRIKEENKIWFSTKQEAEALGYRPAGNCPGL